MRFRIDNLPRHTTEHDMRQLFSGYGKVLSVTLLPGPLHSKQFDTGLIELESNKIPDTGAPPNHCSFRGTILRITQDRDAIEKPAPKNTLAPGDPSEPGPRRPDNRSQNVFRVASVEEVFDAANGKPNGWCRYLIKSLGGSVAGQRPGSVAEVTQYAEEAAEAFNQRNMLGNRWPSFWISRQNK